MLDQITQCVYKEKSELCISIKPKWCDRNGLWMMRLVTNVIRMQALNFELKSDLFELRIATCIAFKYYLVQRALHLCVGYAIVLSTLSSLYAIFLYNTAIH